MQHFKVDSKSEQWKFFHKMWTFQDKWKDNAERIKELLGCDIQNNLRLCTHALVMENPPKHLIEQFKKPFDGLYKAKKNSEINKRWISLVDELGLENYTTVDFLIIDLGLDHWKHSIKTIYPLMNGDYYFSSSKWEGTDWALEVDEPTFLRIRADFLEQNKEAVSNV